MEELGGLQSMGRKESDTTERLHFHMEDMGAIQPGLPSPVAMPFQYNAIVIDQQDCFFTIPLADQDCKQVAFSLP